MGLFSGGTYQKRFRTFPYPENSSNDSLTFAIIGDFGTGIKKADRPNASSKSSEGPSVVAHN